MATKQKDSVAGKEKHTRRLQPSTTPSGTYAAKDHGKAPTGELKKHVPNYLKPTVSSKPDIAGGKHPSHNKPNPTTVRRRSFDRPAAPSQSSSRARGERNAAAAPLKSSSVTVTRNAASSERVSMVVKAVKAQPPLVKVKTLPKVSNVRKEVKSKAGGSEEEPAESEAEDEESLDLNVEEELAKMESHHVDLPHEEHLCADKEHVNEEHESPKQHVDADADEDEEKLISDDITVPEVEVIQDDQESNQLLNEAPAKEDDDDTKKEADADIEEMKTVGLTVKTTPDESETEQVAEKQDQELRSSEEKPEPETVVHKRQVGGPISKKESPAYNDVIEETASKLVEKRVNKVRALAGAFETVISLQQPDSS